MVKQTDAERFDDLVLAVEGVPVRGAAPTPPGPKACAEYRRNVRLQYKFKVFYQCLMAVVAGLAVLLLVWAALQAFRGDGKAVDAVLAAAAAIVGGGGVAFLNVQRKDARKEYEDAVKAQNRCG